MSLFVHDLVLDRREEAGAALTQKGRTLGYDAFAGQIDAAASGFVRLGVRRYDRIAFYLPKSFEAVIGMLGASRAGAVFVPINPVLKPRQVSHILKDSGASVLVTTATRAAQLESCAGMVRFVLTDDSVDRTSAIRWEEFLQGPETLVRGPSTDSDVTALLYTSGSTGAPRGVALSHRNIVVGAASVASYLGNHSGDRLLSVLPLSFDAGFSQLTTAFHVGAEVVLHEHLLARDLIEVVADHSITGITAVPPLWMQIAAVSWPEHSSDTVRYVANTGGKMPGPTLRQLRRIFPNARAFLMYGLTEAFRSTFLDPAEVDRRPDSIGKAIPNAEVMVVRPDGTPCDPGEPGELVHRGPLVSLGYWNDPERTRERFKPAPGQPSGLPNPELAVWSGDTVMRDEEGFLYFVARADEMIKTSGYRVSPTELEELALESGLVSEVMAFGLPHDTLGQSICLVVCAEQPDAEQALLMHFRREMPAYMVPQSIIVRAELPRNPNGKLDRAAVRSELLTQLQEAL